MLKKYFSQIFEDFLLQLHLTPEEQAYYKRMKYLISVGIIRIVVDNPNDPKVFLGYYKKNREIFLNFIYIRDDENWKFQAEVALLKLMTVIPKSIRKINVESAIINDENRLLSVFQEQGFNIDVRHMLERKIDDIQHVQLPKGFSFINYESKLHYQFIKAFFDAFRNSPEVHIYPELNNLTRTSQLIEDKMLSDRLIAKGLIFGIEKDNRIVGIAMLKSEFNKGFVNAIGVIPQYRSMGLGKALMYESLRRLKANGFSEVRLAVTCSNKRAYSLYQSMGFSKVLAFLKGYRYI